MTCPCGKKIYFDLSKHHAWSQANIQNIWKSTCNKQSLHQWVKTNAFASAQQIVKLDTRGHVAIFKSINEQILAMVQIMGLMGKALSTIFDKYQKICKGGQRLTRTQFNQLRAEFSVTFANNMKNFRNLRNFAALQKSAGDIFNGMINKSERGDFNFCSCVPFFQRTGVLRSAQNQCNSVCSGRNILEPDEYIEEINFQ
jgi:hypothetical protein